MGGIRLQQDKCQHHNDLKSEVAAMGDLARQHLAWQAGFEARMDALVEGIRQNNEGQKELKKCVNEIKVDLAKNYVTKKEFSEYCETSEERIITIHRRLEEIGQYQRDSLWRIILYFAPVAALVFTVLTWLFGKIGG